MRGGLRCQLTDNPYGARHWYAAVGDETPIPSQAYWQAENCYLFGESERALNLLDIADQQFVDRPQMAMGRHILRVLCLKDLDQFDEALAVANSRREQLEAVDGNEDYIAVLAELQAELESLSGS